jgi:aminoglycoside phosphotransferase
MTKASPSIGLAADPAVPSRDVLLDPDTVAERLSHLAGVDGDLNIDHCRLRRAMYRIGESLGVVYDLRARGHSFVMSARTSSNSSAVFREAAKDATPVDVMPGVAHDPDTGSVWWTFPNDPKLRNLGTLLDAPQRVRLASGVEWDRSTLIEYAPERSATVQVLNAEGDISGFAKAYLDRDALEVVAQYNGVANRLTLVDGIGSPRALGWARPDRIVVLEPMPGVPWRDLPGAEQQAAMGRFGAAIAHVHNLPIDFGRRPFQRYRPDRVINSADLVAMARPDVADAAQLLGGQLAGGPPPPRSAVFLHGDLQVNNVLFDGSRVHMIDFEKGGSGAAAADLGSILASLMALRLVDPDATIDGIGAALLDGYRAVRALPAGAELRWYTAAAFVAEQVIRAVNRVCLPTLTVLPELFELAIDTLAGRIDVAG